jgi:hypothetical protein
LVIQYRCLFKEIDLPRGSYNLSFGRIHADRVSQNCTIHSRVRRTNGKAIHFSDRLIEPPPEVNSQCCIFKQDFLNQTFANSELSIRFTFQSIENNLNRRKTRPGRVNIIRNSCNEIRRSGGIRRRDFRILDYWWSTSIDSSRKIWIIHFSEAADFVWHVQ